MQKHKLLIWTSLGAISTFLAGILTALVYQAITWAPLLSEIASVTWNDGPIF